MREACKFNFQIHNGNILMSYVTKDPGVSSILLFSGSGINFPRPLYCLNGAIVSETHRYLGSPLVSMRIRVQNFSPKGGAFSPLKENIQHSRTWLYSLFYFYPVDRSQCGSMRIADPCGLRIHAYPDPQCCFVPDSKGRRQDSYPNLYLCGSDIFRY
jgi:hypothetical protein